MVLDNADDLDMFFSRSILAATDSESALPLIGYLPRSSQGPMLITTRDERLGKRLAGIRASIKMRPMSPSEAQGLLEKWQIRSHGSPDREHSKDLLEALGYIPLAITQAGAFIHENHISVSEYLEVFYTSDSELQELLSEDLGDLRRDSQSQNSIIKTWKMSFDLINKQKPRAAEMLSLMAVLDRQGISESLLRDASDLNIDVTVALGTLLAFSLIKPGSGGSGYELHRLVQLATQKWLEIQGTTTRWQNEALAVVAKSFPSGEYETWTTCESLLPHTQKVLRYKHASETNPIEYSTLLYDIARFDMEQGRYEMACAKLSAAVEVQKRRFGPEHHLTLLSMGRRGYTYRHLGKLEEAEKLLAQAIEGLIKVLGAGHDKTLSYMGELAQTYRFQNRLEEAEKLQVQATEGFRRVLGAEHIQTLRSMGNLAITYQLQNRLDEAEKLQMQVIEAVGAMQGTEHPDTLTSMNSLALLYLEQRRWKEAETLSLQVLETRKRGLGSEHPYTLNVMINLACVYRGQGRWEDSETLCKQVLESRKRVLGVEHPATLICMAILADVWNIQDRKSDAIALMENVLVSRRKTLGPNHPSTIKAADWLKRRLDA